LLDKKRQDQDGCSNQILKARLLDGRVRKDWTGTGTDSAEGVSQNLPAPDFYGHDSERNEDAVKGTDRSLILICLFQTLATLMVAMTEPIVRRQSQYYPRKLVRSDSTPDP